MSQRTIMSFFRRWKIYGPTVAFYIMRPTWHNIIEGQLKDSKQNVETRPASG